MHLQGRCACGAGGSPCSPGKHEHNRDTLRRTAADASPPEAAEAPPIVHEVLRSPGQPLDTAALGFFEPRFNQDLSDVRVHTNDQAAASARSVNASAYTVGRNIVFASGRYAPENPTGRRLIAHELTHVLQQDRTSVRALRRDPHDALELGPPSKTDNPFFAALSSNDSELYFGRSDVCPSCHQSEEQSRFPTVPVHHERVTESNIIQWAATYVWGEAIIAGRSLSKKHLFEKIQLREDKDLDQVWQSYRDDTVAKVRPKILEDIRHPAFIGSDSARNHWAEYLNVNWTKVSSDLDHRAIDWLVREIDDTLRTHLIPFGGRLVTDPAAYRALKFTPSRKTIPLNRVGLTLTVDDTWLGKRAISVDDYSVDFEVVGHEAIYFEISTTDLMKSDPGLGKVVGDVAKGTEGIRIVGEFLKGLLSAVVSPVTMVFDTAAKVIDMASQGISALGKWRGWYDIGYTCFSSTCQQYEECVKSGKEAEACRSDILEDAIEQATVILPLYRQGRDCIAGNVEACGGIAALGLGLVHEKLGGLAPTLEEERTGTPRTRERSGAMKRTPVGQEEFEQAAIREAIGRPRLGDPKIAETLEKPKAHEEPHKVPKPKTARPLSPLERIPGLSEEIQHFAKTNGIKLGQLEAEIAELRKNASHPEKVRRPEDPRYDAEMKTFEHNEEHTFERERGTRFWCRFSPGPEKCGVPVGPDVDENVDQSLGIGKRKAKPPRGPSKGDPGAAREETIPSGRDRREAIAERAKLAEKARTAEIKATREAKRQSAIEGIERDISKDRSTQLRIQQETVETNKSRLKGPTKEAKKKALRDEAARYDKRIRKAQAELDALQADPLAKLRAYSYSHESERAVTSRGNVDEYSKLAGGPGKSVKEPSIDHLNSVEEISTYDGFWDLFEDDQKEILSKPYNLYLMEKSLNSSKGSRTRLTDWKEGRIAYGEKGIARMTELKNMSRERLKQDIAMLPKKSGAGPQQPGPASRQP